MRWRPGNKVDSLEVKAVPRNMCGTAFVSETLAVLNVVLNVNSAIFGRRALRSALDRIGSQIS
jgi:hypothetical protein